MRGVHRFQTLNKLYVIHNAHKSTRLNLLVSAIIQSNSLASTELFGLVNGFIRTREFISTLPILFRDA
jgi:hypothetical protein